jgi:hypothetical protein
MSDEDISSAADNDNDTDDEEVDDNPNLESSTSSELVTLHDICFTSLCRSKASYINGQCPFPTLFVPGCSGLGHGSQAPVAIQLPPSMFHMSSTD